MRTSLDLEYGRKVHIVAPDESHRGMWQMLMEGTQFKRDATHGWSYRKYHGLGGLREHIGWQLYNGTDRTTGDKYEKKVLQVADELFERYKEKVPEAE